jgi:hypothetical protein
VFRDLTKIEIPLPDKVTRLADSWTCLDVSQGLFFELDSLVEKTGGARLDGFLDSMGWFFFSGGRGGPDESVSYAVQADGEMLVLPQWQRADDTETPPITLTASGYIPSLDYQGSHIVFFDRGGTGETYYAVAVRFDGDSLPESNPSVIWSGEIPAIFGVSTVVTSVHGGRPFIVCLDPMTGEITAIDALAGSVGYQGTIELGEYQPGGPVASFCQYVNPWAVNPTMLLHDPAANEIIRLELTARTPGEERSIRPVESGE